MGTPEQKISESARDLLRKYAKIKNAVLKIDPALSGESFTVSSENGCLVIAGGTPSGLMCGTGQVIRNSSWRGSFTPSKPIRGMYFATHFENWYDHASFEELDEYLEHLAIWGCNAVRVWFDMHQYHGISDPAAQEKIRRLRHIFRKASSLGMMNCLIGLANEAFADSPEELRADWTGGHDGYRYNLSGHYHLELCPSKPGAMELLMKWRGEVLDAFADCDIRYVNMNPYDQGGCSCRECAPFGANGYLKILPAFAKEVHRRFPNAEIIVDTWRFDVFTDGEWEGFRRRADEITRYSNLVQIPIEDTNKVQGMPEKIRGAVFMEISMDRNLPWGGFGANPLPSPIRELQEKMRNPEIIGSFPYSEGIFEDLNKIMILASEWNMGKSIEEIIREYAAFYFGPEHQEEILKAVMLMEENFGHNAVVFQGENKINAYTIQKTDPSHSWELKYETKNLQRKKAAECFAILEKIRQELAPEIADSMRWRLLYLRGLIDYLLAEKKDPETLEKAFLELYRMYHCVPETIPCLTPPSMEKWSRLIQEHRDGMV